MNSNLIMNNFFLHKNNKNTERMKKILQKLLSWIEGKIWILVSWKCVQNERKHLFEKAEKMFFRRLHRVIKHYGYFPWYKFHWVANCFLLSRVNGLMAWANSWVPSCFYLEKLKKVQGKKSSIPLWYEKWKSSVSEPCRP